MSTLDTAQLSGSLSLVPAPNPGGVEHCVSCPTLASVSAGPTRREARKLKNCLASDTESLLHNVPRTHAHVPKLQLAALCLARLADPITFTQVFPYVNEMIEDFGIAGTPSQVGFYSGVVESVFAVSQLLTILPFARLSDVIGRRPVILVGVIGLGLTMFVFGLSKTFVSILFARCLAGALAGNVAAIHAVLAEITDESNQAVTFPAFGICWPVGSIIGPLIGGTLSHPVDHFAMFKGSLLLTRHPYFLPCLISGIIALGGGVLGYFCLDETLPRKRRELLDERYARNYTDGNTYGNVTHTHTHQINSDSNDPNCDVGMPALLAMPVVRALAISSLALSFLSSAFDVVFVLFCYTPITAGGLGYSPTQIGYALAIAGFSATLLQLLVLPTLLRRDAVATTYKHCMRLWPVAYLMLPLLNIIARAGLEGQNPVEKEIGTLKPTYAVAVWVGLGTCLALTRIANLAFSLSIILVKDTSPTPSALGSANGLAQVSMCMARAIAPAFVSSLFAASVDKQVLGSYLWVCVMGLICWGGIGATDRVNFPHENTNGEAA